jgi:hypothetical protein
MTSKRHVAVAFAAVAALFAPPAAAQDADACIAASESSLTLRKAGKLIDARKALATCAAPACPDPIQTSCQQRLGDIDRAVPSIVFQVKDAAGNDVPGVKITMDGQPRDERAGSSITLDPGEHSFTFEASGQAAAKKTLVIVEGIKARTEIVVLGSPAPAPAAIPPATAVTEPPPAPQSGGSSQKSIGLVIGGVGIAGLAMGSVLGLMASSSWSTAQKEQNGAQYMQAESDGKNASTYANVSTVAFIAGGVAVAAGVVVWLTAPGSSGASNATTAWSLAPSMTPAGGGAVLRGGF